MAEVAPPPAPAPAAETKTLTDEEKDEVMQKAAKQGALRVHIMHSSIRYSHSAVSFYFADANLPYDKFMWSMYNKTPEHWVPLSTITSFKRMREHTAALGGVAGVADAIRKYAPDLKLNDAGDQVTRATELKQEDNSAMGRSIYAVRGGSHAL